MVTAPLIAMWIVALGVLSMGVQKGIAKVSSRINASARRDVYGACDLFLILTRCGKKV